jgi:hypothetical protein
MPKIASLLPAVFLLVVACQSKAKSMAALCDLPDACPECLDALAAGDVVPYQDYLRRHAPHPEMKRVFEGMKNGDGVAVLREAARAERIEHCAFADWLARPITIER